jgi:hypothetical protein
MKYNLTVPRDVVMTICQQIDKDGVDKRKGKKLIRRKYHNKGPNYVWHMDGYDKIKPFGFGIHGWIDGYSRKIVA